MSVKVELSYGKRGLLVDLPEENLTILEPVFMPTLDDEEGAISKALCHPLGCPALKDMVKPSDTVAIAFSDATRPVPNKRILPIILRELEGVGVRRDRIVLINALGTHRPSPPRELVELLGEKLVREYRVVQHACDDYDTMAPAGRLSTGKEMIQACKAAGVTLATAFPVRHALPVVRAKQLVDEGKVGKVLAVKATNHGRMPGGWFIEHDLSGGGAIIDHTVHVADLLRWILEDEFKSVYAEIDTRFYDFDIDDCGTLALEMEKGVFATLDPSWSRPRAYPTWGDVTMEIVGTRGVLSVDVFAQYLVEASNSQGTVLYRGWGDSADLALVADFVSAVREGRRPAADGVDGLRALEVALGAYESARLGEAVTLNRAGC
jgi:UDP-N-acetylglucosamine 3-dehydrogenase